MSRVDTNTIPYLTMAVNITDPEGKQINSCLPDAPLIPASLSKLFTLVCSFEKLGNDPKIHAIRKYVGTYSNLLAANILVKLCGGNAAIRSFSLQFDPKRVQIADGTGMSRTNRATPRSVTNLLTYALERPYAKYFLDCLPVSGIRGTLKERFQQRPGKLLAKTGTLPGVACLAGYSMAENGKLRVFAVMSNCPTHDANMAVYMKASIDKLVEKAVL